jgi:hypothetical protein
MFFPIFALFRRLFIFLSTQIGLKSLMTPVSCPGHTQNRVDIFLLRQMRTTKPCYIRFLAKILDLKVQINEYPLRCCYTDFRDSNPYLNEKKQCADE